MERGKQWLTGIQFDRLPWHTDPTLVDFLQSLHSRYFPLFVILQCDSRAMNALGPKGSAQKLGEYAAAGAIDSVLFDGSSGKGIPMDTEYLRPFLDEAHSNTDLARVDIGVAGGLDAETVRAVMPELLTHYPGLSWDAEGKLHPVTANGSRPLDLSVAAAYIQASSDVIRATNNTGTMKP